MYICINISRVCPLHYIREFMTREERGSLSKSRLCLKLDVGGSLSNIEIQDWYIEKTI
jgi:hypothetical protein